MTRSVAIIMVGGPTKGTRFRPLSFNVAKPIFPLAGQPMVHHPIQACKKVPDLVHIYLVGFYEEKEFQLYVSALSSELKVPVRYLKEDKARGSAGGLSHFKDIIMEDDPDMLFVLNCDVCCTFPLAELQEAQRAHGGLGTILVKKVSKEKAAEFGELVADPQTKELLHYTEKPETFVSDLINCGVYVFSSSLFDHISSVSTFKRDTASMKRASSFEVLATASTTRSAQPAHTFSTGSAAEFIRLDQDVLTPLAGKRQLYVYETLDFWEQIKTPGMALRCSGLYLAQYRRTNPGLLASGDGPGKAAIVGDVYVHPSAKIHPSAKLGPNVAVAANARIGAGVRLISCIILDDVEIKENACVMHSIVGWKSTIGRWSRVQGAGDYEAKLGITILGEDNVVEDEVVVVNCIVLPHKSLSRTVREEIIL